MARTYDLPDFVALDSDLPGQISGRADRFILNEIAFAVNWDHPDTYAILRWIAEQDECDLATAYGIYVLGNLHEHIYFGAEYPSYAPNDQSWALAKTITERSENGFYSSAKLGLHPNLATEQRPMALLEEIKTGFDRKLNGHNSGFLAIPNTLISHDYPCWTENYTGYAADEECLFNIEKALPKDLWWTMNVPGAEKGT